MPMRTRSSENQGKIEFRTRKSRRSVPANLKNVENLKINGSRSEARKAVRLGPSENIASIVASQNSTRRVLSPLNKADSDLNLSPLRARDFASADGIQSPRKRLFEDGHSDKENCQGYNGQSAVSNHPSPVKQKKIETHRGTPESEDSENTTRKKPSLGLSRQEGKQYGLIRQQLHASIPERMLCREKELTVISNFMKKQLKGKTSGSLYVSGAPGTGKTVCLNKVLQKMREDNFNFKESWVNCMSLNQSMNIYQKIAVQICKEELTCKESGKYLEKLFQSSGPKIVLILDEIDQLESKNQEILYKIFEWPSLPNSRLVLVGIANALDLTDRILPRLQSREKCRPELLQFPPYNKDQIIEILNERLKDVNDGLVDKNTVQFCARKVAAVAGDMRKALDIMRRSVELVEIETKRQRVLTPGKDTQTKDEACKSPALQKITLSHVAKVVSEVYTSNLSSNSQGKESLPLQQKVLICTLLLLLKKEKSKEITLPKLHTTYCAVCQKRQLSYVGQEEFNSICQLVEARGIITVKQGKNMRLTKISLRLQESDVEHALQDKTLLSSILEGGIPK